MYSYIKGKIKAIKPTHIVVENNDVGYQILSPYPYHYHLDEDVLVYTHHYVRDDAILLYGFNSEEGLDLFIKLISVSGIGPKSALSILAANQVDETIVAIENADVKFLTKFPGIGTKSAQQIILDLKGKLVATEDDSLFPTAENDVTQALTALGYNKTEIRKVMKKVNAEQSVEDMIKQALQLLIK
ncbi:MAG: Holliday junction branch migration protein RuvA [Acholeplasmataceae bacterium]